MDVSAELTRRVKKMAYDEGFKDVGVASPESLEDLPYGWAFDVRDLKRPKELIPGARAVIVAVLHCWDKSFFTQIKSPKWMGYGLHSSGEEFEGYYSSYMISMTKAWPIVSMLRGEGHEAVLSVAIPMKTAAVRCGLGAIGKNSLLIHPEMGPRLGLMAIVTSAELEPDEPFTGDLCGDCTICLDACPTKALKPYGITIERCLTYASENPGKTSIPEDVRRLEEKLVVKPTENSYIECSICMQVCPYGM
jgi:epoxyqueuosine reductase